MIERLSGKNRAKKVKKNSRLRRKKRYDFKPAVEVDD